MESDLSRPEEMKVCLDHVRVLLDRQHEEGYWVNTESGRWWEGNKVLVTAESLLTLEELLLDLGEIEETCPALAPAGTARN